MTFVDFIPTGDTGSVHGVVTKLSARNFTKAIDRLLNFEIQVFPMKTVNGNILLVTRGFLSNHTPIIIADKNVNPEIKNKVK